MLNLLFAIKIIISVTATHVFKHIHGHVSTVSNINAMEFDALHQRQWMLLKTRIGWRCKTFTLHSSWQRYRESTSRVKVVLANFIIQQCINVINLPWHSIFHDKLPLEEEVQKWLTTFVLWTHPWSTKLFTFVNGIKKRNASKMETLNSLHWLNEMCSPIKMHLFAFITHSLSKSV